jgi:hypothetical protein
MSSAYQAPNYERQPTGVGAGSYNRVPNVSSPYWLSAKFSFDRSLWTQALKLN